MKRVTIKFQSWPLQKGGVACHASGYKRLKLISCFELLFIHFSDIGIFSEFQRSRGRFEKCCSQCSISQVSELVALKRPVLCCVSCVSVY